MNLDITQIKEYTKMYFSDNLIIPEKVLNIYTTGLQAEQVNKIIKNYTVYNCTITDATACIGGNSVYFLKDFKKVIMVEPNIENFTILRLNTCYRGDHFNCSYNNIKYILRQDVVYLDPPWGGSEYKSRKKIDLYLNNINVLEIINEIYNYTRLVALKVPNNFNFARIINNFWNHKIYNITKNEKCIYKLIIFFKK